MYFRRLAVKKKEEKNAVAICGHNLLVKFKDIRTGVFYGSVSLFLR